VVASLTPAVGLERRVPCWHRAREHVLGPRDGDARQDGDSERVADVERGIDEAGGEAGLMLGDARQSSDLGGDERGPESRCSVS
jgi:hypothetical protein